MRATPGIRGGAETLVLAGALVTAAAIGLGAAWWIAQPDRSLTQFERLGGEIGCVCGDCPNRPIATCGCSYAAGMLDELEAAIAAGRDDTQVVDAFEARYGPAIRIKPSSTGFDFAAWAVPLVLLTTGGVVVAALVVRWSRRGERIAAPAPADVVPVGPADEARLRAEVEREIERLGP